MKMVVNGRTVPVGFNEVMDIKRKGSGYKELKKKVIV